jgi:hypothetical protein
MNELLPYEEELNQQWDNITLPNEDMAWEDMKRRLKKEDDDKVLLPFWLRGCAVWGLLMLLLVGLGWGTYHYLNSKKENSTTTIVKETNNKDRYKDTSTNPTTITTDDKQINDTVSLLSIPKKGTIEDANNKSRIIQKASSKIKITAPQVADDIDDNSVSTKKESVVKVKKKFTKNVSTINKTNKIRNSKIKSNKGEDDENFDDKNPLLTSNGKSTITITAPDTQTEITNDSIGKKDTVLKKVADTLVKKETKQLDSSVKPNPEKKEKKKKLTYIVGIGEQQQLPINGQKATPYNALGRKGSLLDYIPSVYVRVKKEEKWFVQAEFKYGAPQYNKDNFLYQQKIVPDTGFNPTFTNITSYKLKKTYYHQLPITFNYYITPNWSVGAGVQWNKFFGALAEVDVNRKNNFTQVDSSISNFTTIDKKDSANLFKKTYFLGIVETQYQWKRFTIGAKYSFGLQPYITFTLPGGNQQKEKSNAVLIFVKYQLWQSKNKK